MLTRYLGFNRGESRNAFRHNEEKSQSRARRFCRRSFDPANSISSVMILCVGRAMIVIVCLASVMVVDLGLSVNQARILKKRVRTRRQPRRQQKSDYACSKQLQRPDN